jgi:hypothetical protein
MLGSAPACSKNFTMSIMPSSTAWNKTGLPDGLLKFTSAPAYKIKNTSSFSKQTETAKKKYKSTSNATSTNSFMHFKEWPKQAVMSGEIP